MDVQKPPLGLMPRQIHNWNRKIAIIEAMERYSNVGMVIPKEWVSELKELVLTKSEEVGYYK